MTNRPSESAREDTATLLATLIPPAIELLRTVGQLVPHGAGITPDGDVVDIPALDVADDARDHPLVEVLEERLRIAAAAGEVRATGIVFDAHVELTGSDAPGDAIAVAIDHRDAPALLVVQPYTRTADSFDLGEEFRQSGDGGIFPP